MTVHCVNPDCGWRNVPKDVHPDLLNPGEAVICGSCGHDCVTDD